MIAMDQGPQRDRVPSAVHAAARHADPRPGRGDPARASAIRCCRWRTRTCAAARPARTRSCSPTLAGQLKANKLRALEAIAPGRDRHREHRLHDASRVGHAHAGAALDRAPRRAHDESPRRADVQPRRACAPRDARRLPALPRDPDALDGQRHLRPRQQRHVLLVFRHGRERAPDPRRRPRHPQRDRSSGFVVETSCRFHRPLSFPETIDAGLRVAQLGTSRSPTRSRLFRASDDGTPAATGRFVHVWVDRRRARPPVDSAAHRLRRARDRCRWWRSQAEPVRRCEARMAHRADGAAARAARCAMFALFPPPAAARASAARCRSNTRRSRASLLVLHALERLQKASTRIDRRCAGRRRCRNTSARSAGATAS